MRRASSLALSAALSLAVAAGPVGWGLQPSAAADSAIAIATAGTPSASESKSGGDAPGFFDQRAREERLVSYLGPGTVVARPFVFILTPLPYI